MIARLHGASLPRFRRPGSPAGRRPAYLLAWLLLASMPAAAETGNENASPAADDADTTGQAPAPAPQGGGLDAPFSPLPGFDMPFDPDFDPGFPAGFGETPAEPYGTTTAVTPPVDNRPDYQPPNIDGYLDIAIGDGNLDGFGYEDGVSGYRLIAGFRLLDVGNARWSIAPEVGYVIIGQGEREDTTVDYISDPQYIVTISDDRTLDASTLAFGARLGWRHERLEPFLRAGLHFYHASSRSQITYSYTPKPGITTPRPAVANPSQSEAEVGLDFYGSLGLAWQLAPVPSLYAEHGVYMIEGEAVGVTSIGFLLNF